MRSPIDSASRQTNARLSRSKQPIEGPEQGRDQAHRHQFRVRRSDVAVEQHVRRPRKHGSGQQRGKTTERAKPDVAEKRAAAPDCGDADLDRRRQRQPGVMNQLDQIVEANLVEVEQRLCAPVAQPFHPPHRKLSLLQRAIEQIRVGLMYAAVVSPEKIWQEVGHQQRHHANHDRDKGRQRADRRQP